MNLSFTTIITSVIFGSVILLLQYFLLKHINQSKYISSKLLNAISLLFIIQMTFPIEYAYTLSMPSKYILPYIRKIANTSLFSLSIFDILMFIWIIGFIFSLLKLGYSYIKSRMLIHDTTFEKYTISHGKKVYKIILTTMETTPFVFGIFSPIIVLPKEGLNKKDIDFIISHEMLHISNWDLLIKYVYEFILCIYWWNPIMYIFRTQMNQAFELRVDDQIIENFTELEKLEYLETLIKFERKRLNYPQTALALTCTTNSLIMLRTNNILREDKRKQLNSFTFNLIVIVLFFIFSVITFEPYFVDNISDDTIYEINSDDSYLVRNKDSNMYDLYINNEFLGKISNPKETEEISKFPIYDKKK